MKAKVRPQFEEGWRLPLHQQGSLKTRTGYLVQDEIKVGDLGRMMRRMRLVDDAWKSLHPDLLSPRTFHHDGDIQLIEGFVLFKETKLANPRYVMQVWEVHTIDLMATPAPLPAPDPWPRPVEMFKFAYVDTDGILVATKHRMTREEGAKIPGARLVPQSRELVLMNENGEIETVLDSAWLNSIHD